MGDGGCLILKGGKSQKSGVKASNDYSLGRRIFAGLFTIWTADRSVPGSARDVRTLMESSDAR
jgi:hypothetical protein